MVRNNVRRSTFLLASPNSHASFQDVAQLVRQVIFAAHGTAVDRYTRTNGRWRNGKHGQDHPVGASVRLRQAKKTQIAVGYLLQRVVHVGRGELPLVLLVQFDILRVALGVNSFEPP